jgi:glycine cleavage system H protein
MASDSLQFQVDKFTFVILTDRFYTAEGLWAKREGRYTRVGLSDYLQQRSGDIAFTEVKPKGSSLKAGDELAVIETIKVNISLSSPITGAVIQVNLGLEDSPDIINQDPYGEGWLVLMEALEGEQPLEGLLEPQAYFEKVKKEAEQETGNV